MEENRNYEGQGVSFAIPIEKTHMLAAGTSDSSDSDSGQDEKPDVFCVAIVYGNLMYLERGSQHMLSLPRFSYKGDGPDSSQEFRREISKRFRIKAHTNIVEEQSWKEEKDQWFVLAVVECSSAAHSSKLVPTSLSKVVEDIDKICGCANLSKRLKSFLLKSESGVSARDGCPWYRLGYYHDLLQTTDQLLEREGYCRRSEAQQIRFADRSTVHQLNTDSGLLYLKVTRPQCNEISTTLIMNKLFPDCAIKPVAYDKDTGILLTKDFGSTISHFLTRKRSKRLRKQLERATTGVVQQWASVQQNSTAHLEELKASGLCVYDAECIRKAYEDLYGFLSKYDVLKNEELETFRSCRTFIEYVLELWKEARLPNTIVHGDLHDENIAMPDGLDGSGMFFDWDLAFIGNPLLDLFSTSDSDLLKARRAYLECWSRYTDIEKLEKIARWTHPMQNLIVAFLTMRDATLPLPSKADEIEDETKAFLKRVKKLQKETNFRNGLPG